MLQESPSGKTITIGDISDEPTKKIDRFQPLADYLAANLSEFGYTDGQVVIASSLEDMIDMIEDGEIDLYFDSPFPALTTQNSAGTELVLRRWKDGDSVYGGLVVASKDVAIRDIGDLRGKVVAAEEPYSTTGYASQAIDIVAAGHALEVVPVPETRVPGDSVGIWFSRDEENVLEAVINGTVPAGFFSDQDLADLPSELRKQLQVIHESAMLPRQVVSVRRGMDPAVVDEVTSLLSGLESSEHGRFLLDRMKTERFDEMTQEDRRRLGDFGARLIELPEADS